MSSPRPDLVATISGAGRSGRATAVQVPRRELRLSGERDVPGNAPSAPFLLGFATQLALGHVLLLYPITQYDTGWSMGAMPVLTTLVAGVACNGAWSISHGTQLSACPGR